MNKKTTVKEDIRKEKKELELFLENTEVEKRNEIHISAVAVMALNTGQPFSAFTTEEIEGLFVVNSSYEELVEKLESMSATLNEIEAYENSDWRKYLEKLIATLIAGIDAEAEYLVHDSQVELPEGTTDNEIFKCLFFQNTNRLLRKKVAALLGFAEACPFEFITPESRSHHSSWMRFLRRFYSFRNQRAIPNVAAALRREGSITPERLRQILDDPIDFKSTYGGTKPAEPITTPNL